jgi:hypothetical protein
MTTWILSTGNSDVQLKTDEHWLNPQYEILEKLYDNSFDPAKVEDENRWTVPARVLGWVYENQLDNNFDYYL